MRTLTAEEIMFALKRKHDIEPIPDDDEPDMTYAEPEPRLEASEMPSGQGEL